jgi:hypothetical protein
VKCEFVGIRRATGPSTRDSHDRLLKDDPIGVSDARVREPIDALG